MDTAEDWVAVTEDQRFLVVFPNAPPAPASAIAVPADAIAVDSARTRFCAGSCAFGSRCTRTKLIFLLAVVHDSECA